MLNTKSTIYGSLAINFIFITFTVTFLVRKGGMSYLVQKVQSLNPINQETEVLLKKSTPSSNLSRKILSSKNYNFSTTA
jgi:hypothetical protein